MKWLQILARFVGLKWDRETGMSKKKETEKRKKKWKPNIGSLPSPHKANWPTTESPDGIIIHSMGEYIDGEPAWEFLERIGLSAHYLISPDGSIDCTVSPEREAYHAGKSEFEGQRNLNSTFLGIELLVEGDHTYSSFLKAIKNPETFTDKQYKSCIWLCKDLMKRFDIPCDRVVRHSDVSGPDVRDDPKKDPGEGFDFDYVLNELNEDST